MSSEEKPRVERWRHLSLTQQEAVGSKVSAKTVVGKSTEFPSEFFQEMSHFQEGERKHERTVERITRWRRVVQ